MTLVLKGPDKYALSDETKSVVNASYGATDFYFTNDSTGNVYQGDADLIENFDTGTKTVTTEHEGGFASTIIGAAGDKIHIPDGLTFGGNTSVPLQGKYGVWEKNDNYVISWSDEDGWNDIEVSGDDPTGSIVSNVIYDKIFGGTSHVETFLGSDGSDAFVFNSGATGDLYKNQADTVSGFDANLDKIVIPNSTFVSSTSAPGIGEHSVWVKDGGYVVTWRDHDGFHDIFVEGDNPKDAIIASNSETFGSSEVAEVKTFIGDTEYQFTCDDVLTVEDNLISCSGTLTAKNEPPIDQGSSTPTAPFINETEIILLDPDDNWWSLYGFDL